MFHRLSRQRPGAVLARGTTGQHASTAVRESIHRAIRQGGEPLDARAREGIAPGLGFDLSTVRIHHDALAAETARAIDARAFTLGRDVFFGANEYRPKAPGFGCLLRHELAHVAQQSARDHSQDMPRDLAISEPDAPLELAAHQGDASTRSGPVLARTTFHPGGMHDHRAAGPGSWWFVKAFPMSGLKEGLACQLLPGPEDVLSVAIRAEFGDKPRARAHLDWFVAGNGSDFNEDANITAMLLLDDGVKAAIVSNLGGATSGSVANHFKLEQADYAENTFGQDFRFAFGAIDRLDFEADFTTRALHVWFQDRYEWHPVYPWDGGSMYPPQSPDDSPRTTNCVHAAMVELKDRGAADFWMKGEATVPLDWLGIHVPAPPSKGGGG